MTDWDIFFRKYITKIFEESETVTDIGGGLRVLKNKGNRYDPKREWIRPLLKNVRYQILDPVPDYEPDIIGDIHNLPFEDETQDAIICIAVLEHVENPILAFQEMYRSLKPGGQLFVYVPFLFYYHAHEGYYKDFWRFTKDSLMWLGRDFSHVEIQPVRGAIETWVKISPLGRFSMINRLANILDRITGKDMSNQVSGYNAYLRK